MPGPFESTWHELMNLIFTIQRRHRDIKKIFQGHTDLEEEECDGILCTGDSAMDKVEKVPFLGEFTFQGRKQMVNK